MSYILNIDTAVVSASVCLAYKDEPLHFLINHSQKDSASWLHIAIGSVIKDAGITFRDLDAIAISSGPGSYTGLRVGMSAAKGLSYALNKPLIAINTLKMMAQAALNEPTDLLCPLIDARRVEVFTAIYDKSLNEIWPPANIILNENTFSEILGLKTVTFFGNGSEKLRTYVNNVNAHIKTIETTAKHLTGLSFRDFQERKFSDLAYSEPFYGKDFYLQNSKLS